MFLAHEGSFVHHQKYLGRITNLGVTIATLEEYQGRKVTEVEMRSLTTDEVAPIIKAKYWDPICSDYLASGLE